MAHSAAHTVAQPRLSKSRYTIGLQCPKILWMDRNMPEEFDDSVVNEAILATGNVVGDLAMGYFGDFVEIPFDRSDFAGMARRTEDLIRRGTPVICEATFMRERDFCMVDICRIEPDGVHIVEVKSSTSLKDEHLDDMAYQTWLVLESGLRVKSVSLMHLNGGYVRHGDLDLNALFTVEDCTAEVMAMVGQVPANAAEIRRVMAQESEPLAEIGPHCGKPHECGYRRWCQRHVPTPSVYDLKRMGFARAMRLEEQGIVTLPEALDAGVLKSRRQIVQAECVAQDLDEIVDRDEIAHFLDALSFPLCFLDFETWNPAIPPFDGTHPYQQLTTQYSLHVLESPAGPLTHHEFLARCGSDPRRQVAEHLVADVPAGACTLAYSKGFEVARIRELARAFPDLARPLTDICDNMADLLVPFDRGWYHNRAIGGSDSLKSVVPALFAGDADLDYHALEGVHNGSEATDAYARLADMSPEEAARTREQLLRYCELDTYALVKIVQRLADLTGRWPEMRGLGAESVEHVPAQVQPADAPAAANAGTTSPERDEGPATPSRLRSLLGRIFHSR